MIANILTLKTIHLTVGEWDEPRGLIACVHHELVKGRFVNVALGSAGLLIREPGKTPVAIPLANLLSYSQEITLTPPAKEPAQTPKKQDPKP
jgi:hypothetical protein